MEAEIDRALESRAAAILDEAHESFGASTPEEARLRLVQARRACVVKGSRGRHKYLVIGGQLQKRSRFYIFLVAPGHPGRSAGYSGSRCRGQGAMPSLCHAAGPAGYIHTRALPETSQTAAETESSLVSPQPTNPAHVVPGLGKRVCEPPPEAPPLARKRYRLTKKTGPHSKTGRCEPPPTTPTFALAVAGAATAMAAAVAPSTSASDSSKNTAKRAAGAAEVRAAARPKHQNERSIREPRRDNLTFPCILYARSARLWTS